MTFLGRPAAAFMVVLVVSGCATTTADVQANRILADARSSSREALACREAVAAKPRYQAIAARMPLVEPDHATLAQMTDHALPSEEEVAALAQWMEDNRRCRQMLLKATLNSFPTAAAIFSAKWQADDSTFVLLAQRKLSWGDATLRLRGDQTQLLTALTDRALQLAGQLASAKQAELSRRVGILAALTNLAP